MADFPLITDQAHCQTIGNVARQRGNVSQPKKVCPAFAPLRAGPKARGLDMQDDMIYRLKLDPDTRTLREPS